MILNVSPLRKEPLRNRVPAPPALAAANSSWRGLTQNRLFLRLLTAWFLNALANAIPAILFPLYCAVVLETGEQTRNLLLGLYFTSAVIGIPAWLYLSNRLGKHRAWSIAMLLTCPAFAVAAGNPAIVIKRYDFAQNQWVKTNTKLG